jgi:hypothetical protein
MVEISLSGSEEGPGWATAPGYSTAGFPPGPITRGYVKQRVEPRGGTRAPGAAHASSGPGSRGLRARPPAGRSPPFHATGRVFAAARSFASARIRSCPRIAPGACALLAARITQLELPSAGGIRHYSALHNRIGPIGFSR